MPRPPAVDDSQLDLFEPVAAAPMPLAAAAPKPDPEPAAAPAVPISELLTPATFRHPRASREARLNGHVVGYEFRRAKRKSIGFTVGTEGLAVSAPRWVGLAEVETALQEKARWILAKLQEQDERARRLQTARASIGVTARRFPSSARPSSWCSTPARPAPCCIPPKTPCPACRA